MSQSLNLLVSNFTQQYTHRVNYDLYEQIKQLLPVATYVELRESLTNNRYIKPLLLAEITKRLSQANYTAKYSNRENVVIVYIDHDGVSDNASPSDMPSPSSSPTISPRASPAVRRSSLIDIRLSRSGSVDSNASGSNSNASNTVTTASSATDKLPTSLPAPPVLALSDCVAYICQTIKEDGSKTVKLIKFSSLSHPEYNIVVSKSFCGNNSNGNGNSNGNSVSMSFPVIIEEDPEDNEFTLTANLLRQLLTPANDDKNSLAKVPTSPLRGRYPATSYNRVV